MNTAALVIANPDAGQLGHARRLDAPLGDDTVLGATLRRVARTPGLTRVLVLHPENRPIPELSGTGIDRPVEPVAIPPDAWNDANTRRRAIRRAWTLDGWRGGFRGATVWDELTPTAPLAEVAAAHGIDAALILGADWPMIDPALCSELLAIHRSAPDNMKLCFSQAPPGLCGVVVAASLLHDMANTGHDFASLLAYNPRRPALDPIGLEFNAAVPPSVRDTARRFIFDTPEAQRRITCIFEQLGTDHVTADAFAVTETVRRHESARPAPCFESLPPQIVVELTPRRLTTGPSTPGHHADIEREDLPFDVFTDLAPQLRGRTVTLGGVGDPRLHPRWTDAVSGLKDAGALVVALETDLLAHSEETPEALAEQILAGAPDVVFVRLHAETAETHAKETGTQAFAQVLQTLQRLFNHPADQRPAIVPMLAKTDVTTPELETFFERWWQLADHAVIQRFSTGGTGDFALAPDRNPVPMDPPWAEPDPFQRKQRLTVWSNGDVSLCHQDWFGRAALGNVRDASLLELWRRVPTLNLDPAWSPDHSPMCRRCFDFATIHATQRDAVVC